MPGAHCTANRACNPRAAGEASVQNRVQLEGAILVWPSRIQTGILCLRSPATLGLRNCTFLYGFTTRPMLSLALPMTYDDRPVRPYNSCLPAFLIHPPKNGTKRDDFTISSHFDIAVPT